MEATPANQVLLRDSSSQIFDPALNPTLAVQQYMAGHSKAEQAERVVQLLGQLDRVEESALETIAATWKYAREQELWRSYKDCSLDTLKKDVNYMDVLVPTLMRHNDLRKRKGGLENQLRGRWGIASKEVMQPEEEPEVPPSDDNDAAVTPAPPTTSPTPLSRACLQELVKLSAVCPLPRARGLLHQAVRFRQTSLPGQAKTDHLLPQDVMRARAQVEQGGAATLAAGPAILDGTTPNAQQQQRQQREGSVVSIHTRRRLDAMEDAQDALVAPPPTAVGSTAAEREGGEEEPAEAEEGEGGPAVKETLVPDARAEGAEDVRPRPGFDCDCPAYLRAGLPILATRPTEALEAAYGQLPEPGLTPCWCRHHLQQLLGALGIRCTESTSLLHSWLTQLHRDFGDSVARFGAVHPTRMRPPPRTAAAAAHAPPTADADDVDAGADADGGSPDREELPANRPCDAAPARVPQWGRAVNCSTAKDDLNPKTPEPRRTSAGGQRARIQSERIVQDSDDDDDDEENGGSEEGESAVVNTPGPEAGAEGVAEGAQCDCTTDLHAGLPILTSRPMEALEAGWGQTSDPRRSPSWCRRHLQQLLGALGIRRTEATYKLRDWLCELHRDFADDPVRFGAAHPFRMRVTPQVGHHPSSPAADADADGEEEEGEAVGGEGGAGGSAAECADIINAAALAQAALAHAAQADGTAVAAGQGGAGGDGGTEGTIVVGEPSGSDPPAKAAKRPRPTSLGSGEPGPTPKRACTARDELDLWTRWLTLTKAPDETERDYFDRHNALMLEIGPDAHKVDKIRLMLLYSGLDEPLRRRVQEQRNWPKTPLALIALLKKLRHAGDGDDDNNDGDYVDPAPSGGRTNVRVIVPQ